MSNVASIIVHSVVGIGMAAFFFLFVGGGAWL